LLFLDLPPLGEVARRAEGGLVSLFRVPRAGGDPDPYTLLESGPPDPPLPTLSPSRGERALFYLRHCERSEATQGTDTDLS